MENPIEPVDAQAALDSKPAWSRGARIGFGIATLLSVALVAYGLSLVSRPYFPLDVVSAYNPTLGVTLIFIGLLFGGRVLRWLVSSTPDTPYRPGDPSRALWLLIVAWLGGTLFGTSLTEQSLSGVKTTLILSTTLGLAAAGAGALWQLRRLGATTDQRWSLLESAASVRSWLNELSVFYVFVWGVFSVVLALGAELVLLELVGPSLESRLADVLIDPNAIQDLLRDPVFVIGVIVAVTFVAPLIEELFKAIGLIFFRGRIRSASDGLLLGVLAGMGFGFVESAIYIAGTAGSFLLVFAIWLRVATLWIHSLTTGLTGAGYARKRLSGDGRALWQGFRRAVALHAMWNGAAVLIVGSLFLDSSGALSFILLIAVALTAFRVLPKVALAAIEQSIQEDHAMANAALPQKWIPIEDGVWWRLAGGRPQHPLQQLDSNDTPVASAE